MSHSHSPLKVSKQLPDPPAARETATTEEAIGAAITAGGKGKTVAQKKAAIGTLKTAREQAETRDIGTLEQAFSGIGGFFAGTKSAEEQKTEEITNLLEEQKKLEESIRLVELNRCGIDAEPSYILPK